MGRFMVELDEIKLAKLARELAMNVRPYKDVFDDFGITETDYYEISKLEFFIRAKEQFTLEWNATMSTGDRIKIGSLAYLEQILPAITRRALDLKEPLPAATDVAKLLARNAGIGEAKSEAKGSSERFVITINLGADTEGKPIIEKYDKSLTVDAHDIDPAAAQTVPTRKVQNTIEPKTEPTAEDAEELVRQALLQIE
jgi:hypothetical protein